MVMISSIRAVVTGTPGEFELVNIPQDIYRLKFSYFGFSTDSITVEIINKSVNLGQISMTEKPLDIEAVEVTGHVPAVEITSDTVQFNANAFQTMPDATAEECK